MRTRSNDDTPITTTPTPSRMTARPVLTCLITPLLCALALTAPASPVAAASVGAPELSPALTSRMLSCYVFVGGGSGVLLSSDGLVLTNNHVIDGVENLSVRTLDGVSWPTRLLGTDPVGDIALLKIDPEALKATPRTFAYAEFAVASDLTPGIPVVAVGNPFGLGDFDDVPTLTTGVLSTGRIVRGDYTDAVQADAPVNPGNSGGPLFDLQGRLLGINGQIRSLTGFRINSGIALAVDAVQLRAFVALLKDAQGGYVRHTTAPAGMELAQTDHGVVVKKPGTSSLLENDVLVSIGGRAVGSKITATGLFQAVPFQDGVTTEVVVMRGAERKTLTLALPHLAIPGRPYHGLTFVEDEGQTVVEHVDGDSPAAKAGLLPGDIVTKIGDAPITSKITLLRAMVSVEVGDLLSITVRTRTGETKTVQVLLAQHS
jgi:serine protease Do